MTEIVLVQDWTAGMNTTKFLEWIEEMNIKEEDWNFVTTGIFANPKFIFVHEEDAVAFKLKFL
jgi:hypothetical protein